MQASPETVGRRGDVRLLTIFTIRRIVYAHLHTCVALLASRFQPRSYCWRGPRQCPDAPPIGCLHRRKPWTCRALCPDQSVPRTTTLLNLKKSGISALAIIPRTSPTEMPSRRCFSGDCLSLLNAPRRMQTLVVPLGSGTCSGGRVTVVQVLLQAHGEVHHGLAPPWARSC